jgi:hypothetical protein
MGEIRGQEARVPAAASAKYNSELVFEVIEPGWQWQMKIRNSITYVIGHCRYCGAIRVPTQIHSLRLRYPFGLEALRA